MHEESEEVKRKHYNSKLLVKYSREARLIVVSGHNKFDSDGKLDFVGIRHAGNPPSYEFTF